MSKEISKFLAGFVFSGLFGHIWLAYSGLLPMKLWIIKIDFTLNNIAIAFHIILTISLVYYAWFRKVKFSVLTSISQTGL